MKYSGRGNGAGIAIDGHTRQGIGIGIRRRIVVVVVVVVACVVYETGRQCQMVRYYTAVTVTPAAH